MLLNRERANELMDRDGLDALVAVSPDNVLYLSDFETDFLYDVPWVACAILPRSPDITPILIVTEIEIAALLERPTWMPEVRTYYFDLYGGVLPVHTFNKDASLRGEDIRIREAVSRLEEKPYIGLAGAVAVALKERGLDKVRLGFDDVRAAALFGDAVDHSRLCDASNTFIDIRMVKTPDEITILREAAKKNQAALQVAVGAIHEGATWQDVVTAYEVSVVKQGARPFASFNGAGLKSAGASRIFKEYPINRGDMICFDSMLKYRRYMGDMQRTAVLGQAPEKMERYWKALSLGVDETYGALRPGMSTRSLAERAVETVSKSGIPDFKLAFIHGVGLSHIELPYIAGGKLGEFLLEENMTINMDMELHEIGFGGVFFEETMLLTRNGAERLYSLTRDLIRV
ncbi:MAG TPA: M24 family metallopeptidase [Blastocatellia bacterium]